MVPNNRMDGCKSPIHPALFLVVVFSILLSACQTQRSVQLALLGDINLGRGVTPTSDSLAAISKALSGADLALANLESPLCPAGTTCLPSTTGYNLCAPAERADLLAAWGLDLLALENNHSSDCNPDGLADTRAILASAGLTGLTSQPYTIEINGLNLTFLAFEDVTSLLDGDAAAEAIRLARASGALVIVSIHWGVEYWGAPTARQEALALEFSAAGATLVWGHHPHVLQPCSGCANPQDAGPVILYSLGNALFDQAGLADTHQSALMLITLDESGVSEVEAIPFEIDVPHSRIRIPDETTTEEIMGRLGLK
jgi:poly-gamma-glutamate capsule biosynthesis protein CapA/YwtB (metallophosphatase superfamily)